MSKQRGGLPHVLLLPLFFLVRLVSARDLISGIVADLADVAQPFSPDLGEGCKVLPILLDRSWTSMADKEGVVEDITKGKYIEDLAKSV